MDGPETKTRSDPAGETRAAAAEFRDDDRYVRAVLHRLGVDPHAADDVSQETWLAALRLSGATLHARRAWLGTVARNFAFQLQRGTGRRRRREREAARPERVVPAESDAERTAKVRAALASLPSHYERVLRLRFYDDLPPTLIAERLGIPIETARTRLKRGLAALHAALAGGSPGQDAQ